MGVANSSCGRPSFWRGGHIPHHHLDNWKISGAWPADGEATGSCRWHCPVSPWAVFLQRKGDRQRPAWPWSPMRANSKLRPGCQTQQRRQTLAGGKHYAPSLPQFPSASSHRMGPSGCCHGAGSHSHGIHWTLELVCSYIVCDFQVYLNCWA